MFNFRKYILRIILFLIAISIFCFFIQEELIKGFNHNKELNSIIIFVFLTHLDTSINESFKLYIGLLLVGHAGKHIILN